MRHHNLEFDMLLRGIVMTRGENGATISEMKLDYYELIGEEWPLYRTRTQSIVKYLTEIEGLMMNKLDNGLCIWYIDDLGSNVSEHDSNNNVITVESTVATVSENNQPAHNNSYAIPAPRCRIITSSVREHAQGVSSTSTSTDHTLLIESMENGGNLKRNLSQNSHIEQSTEKRPRMMPPNGLALNEENLDIHNRENGASSMVTQTTSTEIEKSISIPNILINGSIVPNDYIAPIKEPIDNQLQQAFRKRCQINGNKHDFIRIDSTETSMNEELFPPNMAVIGDDFMRSFISFELYGADFTHLPDDEFQYCISGQTVREAYHLVLDRQNLLKTKYRYMIVNIGAIDILLERDFIDIIAEYARLIRAILLIGLTPIITTVPMIWINSNNKNYKTIYQTLLLFNQFILNNYKDAYLVLDLYSCFSERKSQYPSVYYYNQPKTISKGKKLELWPWTQNARKKILEKINELIQPLAEV